MKKNLAFLLILIMTVIFTQSGNSASAAAIEVATRTVDTSATSQLEVAPDIAYINANISIIDVISQ